MLSTLTIISIFTEIFTAGILASGGLTFIKSYLSSKQTKELFFSLVLFSLFAFVAFSLTSQLMFNLGRGLAEMILVQRYVAASLALGGFFLWLFIVEKFELKKLWPVTALVSLASLFLLSRLSFSAVNLVYREEIIEPIVTFAAWLPLHQFFILLWGAFTFLCYLAAIPAVAGKRSLLFFSGTASLLLLIAFFFSNLYVSFADPLYMLISWLMILGAVVGLLLGELVPPESPEARSPLRFLRTRILFKLMLIFVLLIVILFEATTLATINISKNALSRAIQREFLKLAENLADDIQLIGGADRIQKIQAMINHMRVSERSVAFVVDQQGRLLAHPDRKRALQREEMSGNGAVRILLAGGRGASEFHDELGSSMVGAYVPVPGPKWGVVIEAPMEMAYFEMRLLETNSLIFVIFGIILTALTGIYFANSIERPIKELTRGTEAVARGELGYRISVDSIDEIGKLATAYNQMTKDLRDSQERLILSEKLASLGTMAAGMAHEIKNPLVSLRTFTQLLEQKWDDKEFREKFSSIIPHEIERINRIAESLLKFGRPMKPELTRVDVNVLLDEVLLLFESECKKHNVRVTKKFAELPEVAGDAGQLSQAFVNLIKNAIEAMQEKGGELTVKTDLGEVIRLGKMHQRQGTLKGEEMVWGEEEEMEKPMPVVFIEVSDTGEGISEENLKSLFDPFFTTKMTGTGMGLPITLRIIEEHKGSIKVRSRVGRGTTFIITLPQKI